jgi:hypothetical protein
LIDENADLVKDVVTTQRRVRRRKVVATSSMTLVVAFTDPRSIWLMVDRRITFKHAPPRDNATKITELQTTDGLALIGYAGLGLSVGGMEPSQWISNVLRGRNVPLETALGLLTDAVRRELPSHLRRLSPRVVGQHHMVVPAIVKGEPRIYTIGLAVEPFTKKSIFRYTRFFVHRAPRALRLPTRAMIAGSGLRYMPRDKWAREFLRLLRAHGRGQLAPFDLARHLASLNHGVHKRTPSVGPDCIVTWRFAGGGGAHQCFAGTTPTDSHVLPYISRSADMQAFLNTVYPLKEIDHLLNRSQADVQKSLDEFELLAKGPDERLK